MKRKKTHKTPARHTRRRRVGAIGGGDTLNTFAGALGGFVAGNILSQKLFPTMDAKIKGAVIAAAGVLLVPKFMGNSPLFKGLSLGLGVAGGSAVLKSLGVISGVGALNSTHPIYALPMSTTGVNSMVNGNRGGNQGVSSMVNGRMNSRQSAMFSE